jgi:glycine/D-amino acid oxidase-like deaminating enzyme
VVSPADSIRRIVVVGGGTAGWIAAGVLAARFPNRGPAGVSVTLIESRLQPPIGVGEGTWPTIRSTLQQIGVSETDFLRECEASFKQGSKFVGWVNGAGTDAYYHPFTLPADYMERNLAPYWLEGPRTASFADSLCFQTRLCDHSLAPKLITTPEFAGVANYAYHLDAGKFVPFLQQHCIGKLGVTHVLDEIQGFVADDAGGIAQLLTRSGTALAGDLFIDCSGFAALVIGKHFGVPFISCKDSLFIDKALAVQVPYETEDAPIASVTLSTAQSAGWIWDIGLTSRRGVGYVYSSSHTTEEAAAGELRAYLGGRDVGYRSISITSGYRREFWVGNCVAVGLSAGFLEPLEASAIVMIELAAKSIAGLLPGFRSGLPQAARIFNELFQHRWQRIVEFLKLHYVLSRRPEPFWVDNRQTVPDYWRQHSPWHEDFSHREEVFSAASFQYVLYGMGFEPESMPWLLNEADRSRARDKMAETARHGANLAAALPTNRDLLGRIRKYGLQKI